MKRLVSKICNKLLEAEDQKNIINTLQGCYMGKETSAQFWKSIWAIRILKSLFARIKGKNYKLFWRWHLTLVILNK